MSDVPLPLLKELDSLSNSRYPEFNMGIKKASNLMEIALRKFQDNFKAIKLILNKNLEANYEVRMCVDELKMIEMLETDYKKVFGVLESQDKDKGSDSP